MASYVQRGLFYIPQVHSTLWVGGSGMEAGCENLLFADSGCVTAVAIVPASYHQKDWRCHPVEVLINCPSCGMKLFNAARGVQHCNECGYWTKKVWIYA